VTRLVAVAFHFGCAAAVLLSACAADGEPGEKRPVETAADLDARGPTGDVDLDDPFDGDGDGVGLALDCDDHDPRVGRVLFADDFGSPSKGLAPTPELGDHWSWEQGAVRNVLGGQQALLGPGEWTDTVTYATLSADGLESECPECPDTARYRAGVLARAALDADQYEGFHGYRCAVAANEEDDCWDEGSFLQLGGFLDAPEDRESVECDNGCQDNAWEQFARVERTAETDLVAGDTARLAFWAVGNDLTCEMFGEGSEYVRAEANVEDFVSNEGPTIPAFASGGTGLSVLNAYTAFDELTVCEVLSN
jgi:hypothetical protein